MTTDTPTKRPLFVLPTEGKSREQIKAEAREALQRYQAEDDSEADSRWFKVLEIGHTASASTRAGGADP